MSLPAARCGGVLRQNVTSAETELYRDILKGLRWQPRFHLIMIAGGGPEALQQTRRTLASLLRQNYAEWRLSVIFRAHPESYGDILDGLLTGTRRVGTLRALCETELRGAAAFGNNLLEGLAALDSRVAVIARNHIVDLFKAGSPLTEYVIIVSPGDELSADCLAELAVETGVRRRADFFYSDEERIEPQTGELTAFRKPEWSPDLLLSTNYIGRLWCATGALLERAGASPADLLRYGEYDLILRCTEQAAEIRRLPKLLCRRGIGDREAPQTERAALQRALRRRNIAAEVTDGHAAGSYRVRRTVGQPGLVSIIIPTRASRGLIKRCIESIRGTTDYPAYEIICLDNIPAAEAGWKVWLRKAADRVIEIDEPFNWSRFNNRAAGHASGAFLLFLNDDIEAVEPGWLRALVEQAQRPEVGAVGPLLLYPSGTIQHAGMFLVGPSVGRHAFRHKTPENPGYFGLAMTQRNVSAVTGACLLTRRDVFERLGRFEEAHDIVNNDLDYCLKVRRAGLLCVYTPFAKLIHHERATREAAPDHFDTARFRQEWGRVFAAGDPYHHPMLSSDVDDLAVEPEPIEAICVARPLFERGEIRKIAVLKLDHLGDCVGAIPAVRRLKETFPAAEIVVLCGSWSKPIWSMVPEVSATIALDFFDSDSANPPRPMLRREVAALHERLAPCGFDLAVDLRRHTETRRLLRCTGARYTAGFDHRGLFPWLDIALDWHGDQRGVRKRQYFGDALLDLVGAIAAATEPPQQSLDPQPRRPRSIPAEVLDSLFRRRVVCIHAGAGTEIKRWPAGHFAELIDRLIEEEDVNVALIGGPSESKLSELLLAEIANRERVTVLVGQLPLAELAGFLASCALFVGNDSGPKHIAAGLGVPTIGIQPGNVDVREWGPAGPRAVAMHRAMQCSPCYLTRVRDCERGLACLTGLSPSEVYRVCKRMLAMGYGHPEAEPAFAGLPAGQ